MYNASAQAPTAVLGSQIISGDVVNITVSGAKTNVGSYTATASTDNTNYAISDGTATHGFAITQKTVTVSFTNTEKTYNGSLLTPDVTLVGKYAKDNVAIIYTIDGTQGGVKAVGEYTVVVSTTNQNYTLDSTTVTLNGFKVTPKTVTASWSNTSLTYNGSVQNPTVTLNGVVKGDTVPVTLSAGQSEVGNYTATATISNSNYYLDESTASCPFEIKPMAVNAKWNAPSGISYTYDGTAKTPTATVAGFEVSYSYEKLNVETGDFEAISSAPTEVGDYRVTVSINSQNHTLTNETLDYSIIEAPTAAE